jgi:competence protein ComEA
MPERAAFTLALFACGALVVYGVVQRWPTPAPLRPLHTTLRVQVAGAVVAPGAYTLPWGSRVEDLVRAAGGVLPGADLHLIPWSLPVSDGSAWVIAKAVSEDEQLRVDINGSPATALVGLPGIGPVMAERIIAGRPYHRVDDLLRVVGIGEVRLAALRPLVTLGSP